MKPKQTEGQKQLAIYLAREMGLAATRLKCALSLKPAWRPAKPADIRRLTDQLARWESIINAKIEGREIEPEPKVNKYRAKRVEYKGVWYASGAEAKRAEVLDLKIDLGVDQLWIGQPTIRLGLPECTYRADAVVLDKDNGVRVEDIKGMVTPKFARDKRLWRTYGPCPLWIITGKKVEIIPPGPKANMSLVRIKSPLTDTSSLGQQLTFDRLIRGLPCPVEVVTKKKVQVYNREAAA